MAKASTILSPRRYMTQQLKDLLINFIKPNMTPEELHQATTRKLRPLLLDIGHQIESMETPGIDDIRTMLDKFEQAMADDDLVELRKVGTKLAAMVGKVVV